VLNAKRYAFLIALLFALCAMPLPFVEAATVTLAWDPNQEPDVAGYTIHYGTFSRNYQYSVDVGNVTSCTVSNLDLNETYYFAVTANDDAGNESAYSDEVSTSIGPVEFISPNSTEIIPADTEYAVEWKAVPEAEYFKLRYSLNRGKKWITIEKGILGTTYNWQVPTLTSNKRKCLMKVIAYDSADKKIAEEISAAFFTIEVIRVTSLNGDDTLISGNTYNIEWITHDTKEEIAKVLLKYTVNGGKKWNRIKTIKGDIPGNYSWTVPDVTKAKNKCKVKVELKDTNGNSLGTDSSNGYFTIEL
jgi:hypothetical protein